jgi:hypothetical protein
MPLPAMMSRGQNRPGRRLVVVRMHQRAADFLNQPPTPRNRVKNSCGNPLHMRALSATTLPPVNAAMCSAHRISAARRSGK